MLAFPPPGACPTAPAPVGRADRAPEETGAPPGGLSAPGRRDGRPEVSECSPGPGQLQPPRKHRVRAGPVTRPHPPLPSPARARRMASNPSQLSSRKEIIPMATPPTVTRRQALQLALGAAAAPAFIPARLLGADAPSKQIVMGFIGVGWMGEGNL